MITIYHIRKEMSINSELRCATSDTKIQADIKMVVCHVLKI